MKQFFQKHLKLLIAIFILIIALAVALFIFLNKNKPRQAPVQKVEVISEAGKAWNKRVEAAVAPTECKKVEAPKYSDKQYEGPIIDTHYHIDTIPDFEPENEEKEKKILEEELALANQENRGALGLNIKISEMVCNLEQENTKKVFAFFPVYREIYPYQIEVVKRTMEKYPDRFVPFLMPPDDDGNPKGFPTVEAETLSKMLKGTNDLFKGFGEIGLYARGDHGGPKGAPALPPDSKRLKEIYPILKENKLAAYFHLGEGQKESYEKILSENPDINFIFHGDQLIPTSGDKQDLSNIEDIIKNHPNVFYTIDELYGNQHMFKPENSKEIFLNYLKDSENLLKYDLGVWKGIIEKYPNQFMAGTDRGVLWTHGMEVGLNLSNYTRAFIAGLDPAVQENFAYKNAERLLQK